MAFDVNLDRPVSSLGSKQFMGHKAPGMFLVVNGSPPCCYSLVLPMPNEALSWSSQAAKDYLTQRRQAFYHACSGVSTCYMLETLQEAV